MGLGLDGIAERQGRDGCESWGLSQGLIPSKVWVFTGIAVWSKTPASLTL